MTAGFSCIVSNIQMRFEFVFTLVINDDLIYNLRNDIIIIFFNVIQ